MTLNRPLWGFCLTRDSGRYPEDIDTLARKLGAQPQSTPEADYPWRVNVSKRE